MCTPFGKRITEEPCVYWTRSFRLLCLVLERVFWGSQSLAVWKALPLNWDLCRDQGWRCWRQKKSPCTAGIGVSMFAEDLNPKAVDFLLTWWPKLPRWLALSGSPPSVQLQRYDLWLAGLFIHSIIHSFWCGFFFYLLFVLWQFYIFIRWIFFYYFNFIL